MITLKLCHRIVDKQMKEGDKVYKGTKPQVFQRFRNCAHTLLKCRMILALGPWPDLVLTGSWCISATGSSEVITRERMSIQASSISYIVTLHSLHCLTLNLALMCLSRNR